jgi:SpoVK/Ycf46/Vps4 family AAA+-type ATPase
MGSVSGMVADSTGEPASNGDPLLDALRRAVEADPDDLALRAHLAQLVVDRGQHDEALRLSQGVLSERPTHPAALGVAARAADGMGRQELADDYRAILGWATDPQRSRAARAREDGDPGLPGAPDTVDDLVAAWDHSEPFHETEHGEVIRPRLRLADVGGMADVKRRLELSLFGPMRNPEVSAAFRKSLRGGLLLWGPPGCGKTFMARAVAGELGASFYEVGLSQVLDMWIGSSERNLSAVFETARAHRPCVLFFDEMDALGIKRTQLRSGGSAMRGVVNQLLAELDGAVSDNDGVFVMAATNHPWDVDAALLRPGRFDRRILVLPPDAEARLAILSLNLRGRPVGELRLNQLVATTDGLSGADLALVVEDATERALERSIRMGEPSPIGQQDLVEAAASVSSSIGAWLDVARNFAMFNNSDGAYDDLVAYLARSGTRSSGGGNATSGRWWRR